MTSLQVQGRQHKSLKQLIPDLPLSSGQNFHMHQHTEKCAPPKTAGEENEVDNQFNGEQNADEMIKVGVFWNRPITWS